MAKYNSQHDIPYLKFMEFSEVIKDRSNDAVFIADKTIEFFYPEVTANEALYVEEFSRALTVNPNRFFPYRISLRHLMKADNFIDADTFASDSDFESLLKMIVKPLLPFSKVDVNKITLSEGNRIMTAFRDELLKSSNRFNIFIIRQARLQFQR